MKSVNYGSELIKCAANGDLNGVKYYIETLKVDPNSFATSLNGGALHKAVQHGHAHVIEYLISAGANVNVKSPFLGTPLSLATKNRNLPMVELLLFKGASYPQNILHSLIAEGENDLLETYLKWGVNPDATNDFGETPLHVACRLGKLESISKLMSAGCNVNTIDGNGDTALHIACKRGNLKVVKLLDTPQAIFTLPGHNNSTMLSLAVESKNMALVKYLTKEKQLDPRPEKDRLIASAKTHPDINVYAYLLTCVLPDTIPVQDRQNLVKMFDGIIARGLKTLAPSTLKRLHTCANTPGAEPHLKDFCSTFDNQIKEANRLIMFNKLMYAALMNAEGVEIEETVKGEMIRSRLPALYPDVIQRIVESTDHQPACSKEPNFASRVLAGTKSQWQMGQ